MAIKGEVKLTSVKIVDDLYDSCDSGSSNNIYIELFFQIWLQKKCKAKSFQIGIMKFNKNVSNRVIQIQTI